MQRALDEVEKLMREGKTDEALAKLQELAMQMDEMLREPGQGRRTSSASEQYPELAREVRRVHGGAGEDARRSSSRSRTHTQGPARPGTASRRASGSSEKGQALKDELLRKVEQVQKDYQELEAGAAQQPRGDARSRRPRPSWRT